MAVVLVRRMCVGACAALHRMHTLMVAAVVLDHMPTAASYDFRAVAAWRGGGAAGAAQVMWAPEVFHLVVRFLLTQSFREP